MNHLSRSALGLLLLGGATLALASQEPDIEILPPGSEHPWQEGIMQGPQSPEDRMRELFGKVERQLEDIDLLLSDAAAGDTSRLADVENAALDRLLRNSVESGREVQRDIEEIIRIAQSMGSSSSSSGSSEGQGQPGQQGEGESQSSSSGGGQSQSPESTPSMPEGSSDGDSQGQQEQGEDSPGEGDPKQGQEDSAGGQEPESPLGSAEHGANQTGDEQAGSETSRGADGDPGTGGWGNLPQQVQDTFRAEGRGDLPTRYRDWIDSYYLKLNRRSTER